MLLLSSVAAAFRASTASASSLSSAAESTSVSRRSSAASATDRGDDDNERRGEPLPSSASFAAGIVQAATDVIERSHRRYWSETAPPFGIRGGLRKLRKIKRQRQARITSERRRGTVQTGCESATTARTPIRFRSVVAGSLMNGDESYGVEDCGASSMTSEYTWEEEDADKDGDKDETDQTVTHLCFLVHGHRGQSKDLSYMHAAIQGRSSEVRRQRRKELQRLESTRSSVGEGFEGEGEGEGKDDVAAAIDGMRASLGQNVVVHSATCNEGRTNDGVRAGGERLVEEMLQVIRKQAGRTRRKKNQGKQKNGDDDDGTNDGDLNEVVDIHLSLVGNSLGGIYSRYAIAQLFDMSEKLVENEGEPCRNTVLLDNGNIHLHFETFCTTATPHLGCSKHTYISLPRSAENVVGNILGETGRDLFRMNDLLYSMSTDPFFLHPLSLFQRRVAYANGYHTDFPVPTSTAAFLHEKSSYVHFWEDTSAMATGDSELDKSIVAILHTEPSNSTPLSMDCKDDFYDECDDELHAMSKALDSLGWKKIFVDLRPEIPAVSLPRVIRKSSLVMTANKRKGTHDGIADGDLSEVEESLLQNIGTLTDSETLRASLRRKGGIASRDAKEAFGSPRDGSLHFPVGHNMICAFSRGRVSSHMNRGGRPVMDALAKELVDDMFGPGIGRKVI